MEYKIIEKVTQQNKLGGLDTLLTEIVRVKCLFLVSPIYWVSPMSYDGRDVSVLNILINNSVGKFE